MELWVTWIIIIVVVLLVLYIILKYNGIIKLKNHIKNAFADIDVQMKLRFDLIDNLVSTVKWYKIHEQETLISLAQARTSFLNAKNDWEKLAADDAVSGTLKTLFAVSENYPELKANENFLQLQTELSDIENKIAAARRFFNACVKDYNTAIEMFPWNIIAKMFWFKEYEFFAIEESNKKVPEVKF